MQTTKPSIMANGWLAERQTQKKISKKKTLESYQGKSGQNSRVTIVFIAPLEIVGGGGGCFPTSLQD